MTFLPYPCLFLAIWPVGPLTALHDALQATGLFHPVPDHHERFVPHMTILEGTLGPQEIADLARELQETAPTGSFACREIALIVPDAAIRFSFMYQFRIGKRPRLSS